MWNPLLLDGVETGIPDLANTVILSFLYLVHVSYGQMWQILLEHHEIHKQRQTQFLHLTQLLSN